MPASPLQITRISPGSWRVTFDHAPMNLFDPELTVALRALTDQLEHDPDVKVVVFDSADPDYFIAHVDVARADELDRTPGPATGLPIWPDIAVRLERAPFITVASVRGRARGVGSEFILAMDVAFASRERAILGQPEIGFGFIPGGGGLERLYRRTGRARALEIIASGEDYRADVAELYGWINRAVPDAELDSVVNRFAARLASFDREALAAVKEILRQHAGTPQPAELQATEERFYALLDRPTTTARVAELFQRGLQQRTEIELELGEQIGPLAA